MKNPFNDKDVIAMQDIEEYRDYIADIDSTEYDENEVKAIDSLLKKISGCDYLIKESSFVEYITGVINDCYDDVEPKNKTNWPYYCVTVDYEKAARDAKMDYTSITYNGVDYLAR
jgi:hypothetical protein